MSSCSVFSSAPRVVVRDEWEKARSALLVEEKKLTAHRDAVNNLRRELPAYELSRDEVCRWTFVNGSTGVKCSFRDLFGSSDKLLVYHCMSFEDYPCGACGAVIDQFNSVYKFLNRYAATAVIARAPVESLKNVIGIQKWTVPSFTCDSDFSKTFHTERLSDSEDGPKGYFGSIPGLSSFYFDRANDRILHSYSSFNRGVEDVEAFFGWVDRIPVNPENKNRPHPKVPEWPKNTGANNDAKDTSAVTCCNKEKSNGSEKHSLPPTNVTWPTNAAGATIKLDLNQVPVSWPETHYVFLEGRGPFSETAPAVWTKLHKNLDQIKKVAEVREYFTLYNPNSDPKVYRAGVSVDRALPAPPGDFQYDHFKGGDYLRFALWGKFDQLPDACPMVWKKVKDENISIREGAWYIEHYTNDPQTTPTDQLLTHILIPGAIAN